MSLLLPIAFISTFSLASNYEEIRKDKLDVLKKYITATISKNYLPTNRHCIMDQILPGVYVGNFYSMSFHKSFMRIITILAKKEYHDALDILAKSGHNVQLDLEAKVERNKAIHINTPDGSDAWNKIFPYFNEIFDWIDRAIISPEPGIRITKRKQEKKVYPLLIHCYAGHSRSISIILAYLINRLNFSLEEAQYFVSLIRHNDVCESIMVHLRCYDSLLNKKNHPFIESQL